jgi:hypothetical protein
LVSCPLLLLLLSVTQVPLLTCVRPPAAPAHPACVRLQWAHLRQVRPACQNHLAALLLLLLLLLLLRTWHALLARHLLLLLLRTWLVLLRRSAQW